MSVNIEQVMIDKVYPFQVGGARVLGRYAHLDNVITGVLEHHEYPWPVTRLLAELIVVGSLMVTGFKFKGVFTLQVVSKGPVRLLVLDITSDGNVRACAKFDETAVSKAQIDGNPLTTLIPGGNIVFSIDQENEKDIYQGIVEITGNNLSECINHYFRQSEQINTTVMVAVPETESEFNNSNIQAGGIMIQQMPEKPDQAGEEDDNTWLDAVTKMSTLKSSELLDGSKQPEQMLYNLFWEEGVGVFEPKELKAQCRCSMDKITTMLQRFSEADIKSMVVDGQVEVICEFCSKKYNLDPDTLLE